MFSALISYLYLDGFKSLFSEFETVNNLVII